MKVAIFFVALCMVLLFTANALTVTSTFTCSGTTPCRAGEQGDLNLVFDTLPSNDVVVIFAVPSNSTLSGECYQVTESGSQLGTELTYAPVNLGTLAPALSSLYNPSNPQSPNYFSFGVPNASTPLRVRCRYTMAPVQGSVGLPPYSLGTAGSYPVGVYTNTNIQPSIASTLQTATIKFDAPGPAVSTKPNVAKWSAGRGAAGKVIFQLYAPFSVSPFDKISLSGFSEAVTGCSLAGGPAERISATEYNFIVLNGAGTLEEGYLEFTCDLTVPTSASGYPKSTTISVYRMYWENREKYPDGVQTLRYTLSATVTPPPEALIGGADVATNLSLYPNSYIPGGSYRVLFETKDFNTVLSVKTTTSTGDDATVTVQKSKLSITLELGENFLIVDPTVANPRCSWSLSARDFNLFTPDVGATTTSLQNNVFTWTFIPSTQLIDTTGKTVRFACSGLKLDPSASITEFPYKPLTTEGSGIIGTIIAYGLGGNTLIAENRFVKFAPLQLNQGGVEVTYAKHVLKLKSNSQLSKQEVARLIEVYRQVLNLSSTITISVSTQLLSSPQANVALENISGGVRIYASNDLAVYVYIRGTAAYSSQDIATKLNAAAATEIANTLTSDFSLVQISSQSSAQTYNTPAHCNNNILDTEDQELGIDCGGPCLGCAAAVSCVAASDCVSGSCAASKCASLADNNAVAISTFTTLSIAVIAVIAIIF